MTVRARIRMLVATVAAMALASVGVPAATAAGATPTAPRLLEVKPWDSGYFVSWEATSPIADIDLFTISSYNMLTPLVAATTVKVAADTRTAYRGVYVAGANNVPYLVTVTASGSGGTSPPSAGMLVTPVEEPPAKPYAVKVVPRDKLLLVSWSSSDSGTWRFVVRAVIAAVPTVTAATCMTYKDPASTYIGHDCILGNLVNKAQYLVTVTAEKRNGPTTSSDPVAASPRLDPPGPPTDVIVNGYSGGLAVTWERPADDGGGGVSTYTTRLWAASAGGSPLKTCVDPYGVFHCEFDGLTNGATYWVDVVARNKAGDGPPSAPRVSGKVNPRIPSPPQEVAASVAGPGRVTVRWKAPESDGGSAVTGYTATARDPVSPYTARGTCSTSGALTCTISGLANEARYSVSAQARNAMGLSSSSAGATVMLPALPPPPPMRVRAVPGNAMLTVSWNPPRLVRGSPVTAYVAQAWSAASGGGVRASCTTGALATTCALGGLTNGVTYYVAVAARNRAGTGTPSARLAATPRAAPPAPPVILSTEGGARRATVTWGAPADDGGSRITKYTVQAWTAATGGSVAGTCTSSGIRRCTLLALAPGTVYVSVVATNAVGDSPPSSPRVAVAVSAGLPTGSPTPSGPPIVV